MWLEVLVSNFWVWYRFFFRCGVWLRVLVGSFEVVCGVVQYCEWQKVGCFLGGIYKGCLGIPNSCSQHVAIVLSNCIKGLGMGLVGMQVESFDNVIVVETVAKDAGGVGIHGISNVRHVTDIVRWVRHSRDIDTVHGIGSHLALTDLKVCDDNWPVWMLVTTLMTPRAF